MENFDVGLFVRLIALVFGFFMWMVAGYMIQVLHSPLGWVLAACAVIGIAAVFSFKP